MRWFFRSRYPVVRQYDRTDCGPAALLSVLRYWRGDASMAQIRRLACTDGRGSSMLDLVSAAKAIGFDAVGANGDYASLMQEPMPCLAHLVMEDGLQHFVVVYRLDARRVLLGDPASGLRRVTPEQFLELWKTRAVVLLTPNDRLARGPAPTALRWIATHFEREQAWLAQALFLGALYTALGLLTAVFMQWLIDRGIPAKSYSRVLTTGAGLIVLLLLKALVGYLRQRFVVELNRRVSLRVNTDFLQHIFRLPLGFFDSRRTGDITSRINDGVKIQNALVQIIGTTAIDGLVAVGSLSLAFWFAPVLGWLALAVVLTYVVILARAVGRVRVQQHDVMKSYARIESSYIDGLAGIDAILGFNAAPAFAAANATLAAQFQQRFATLGRTQARVSFQVELVAGVLVIASLMVGAVLVVRGELLLGQMLAAHSLIAGMLPSVHRLVESNLSLQGANVAITRLLDLLLVEPEARDGSRPFSLARAVTVEGGRLAWPRAPVLFDGLDLELPLGRMTGLWGESGAGKSTLVKVLERKYALTGGRVLVDGVPADSFDLCDYRRNVASVPENVKIFHGTLAANVLLGRGASDLEILERRLAALGLLPFLARFEAGLLTPVGEEGRRLSAGERQVVGIMRALVDEPAVLIVDEGLSAIDVRIAELMLQTLRHYADRHAVLLVSHNFRMLNRTDWVYLLEGGRIVEGGAPDELRERASRYGSLWRLSEGLVLEAAHLP